MSEVSVNVQCELCPKACRIAPGHSGDCRVRVNLDSKLRTVVYGHPTAVHVDPIEKKPLFHFLPGTKAFSVATVGCNLHCRNCQNWEISQAAPAASTACALPPKEAVALAQRERCAAIAYTYTEPLVFYEYTLDCSVQARKAGLRNVLITAGYINEGPLRELCRYVDAANIDLKAFSDKFYRDICDATLKPVLRTLEVAAELGVLVEVTNLVIPTLNDSDKDLRNLCRWLRQHLSADTPLHFSRFYPQHRMRHLPPTPAETLVRAREIAHGEGLHHVYVGNIMLADAGDTRCPGCDAVVLSRRGYEVTANRLTAAGACPACGREIMGVWR